MADCSAVCGRQVYCGVGVGVGGGSVKEAGNPLPIFDLKELISVFVKKKMLLVCDPLTKTEN